MKLALLALLMACSLCGQVRTKNGPMECGLVSPAAGQAQTYCYLNNTSVICNAVHTVSSASIGYSCSPLVMDNNAPMVSGNTGVQYFVIWTIFLSTGGQIQYSIGYGSNACTVDGNGICTPTASGPGNTQSGTL